MNTLSINQIVKAAYGTFIILGFRTIEGEQWAQLKSYNTVTKKADRGELALPVAKLSAI